MDEVAFVLNNVKRASGHEMSMYMCSVCMDVEKIKRRRLLVIRVGVGGLLILDIFLITWTSTGYGWFAAGSSFGGCNAILLCNFF